MSEVPSARVAPPAFLLDPAMAALLDLLPEARVVGGAVRDTLAGRPIADVDLASPLTPDRVIARLRDAGMKVVPTGLTHGTVTAILPSGPVEITTLRRDLETDGRHAVVGFTEDWRDDAARRDFTINALSMTRDGAVYDYFGGLDDLRAGRLRFVGDPAARVAEDWLRVLRFFRFFARYGSAAPDPATLDALRGAVPFLQTLSVERVWSELRRILSAPDPVPSVILMAQLGLLTAAVPEGTDRAVLARLVSAGAPADPLLRMAALLTGDAFDFAVRMKLSLADRDRLLALRSGPVPAPCDGDAALRRLLAETPAPVLVDRCWLAGVDGGTRARLLAMPRPVFPLEGRDVVALGVPPGPDVGMLLRTVRAWWMDGGCVANAEACLADGARRLRAL